MDKKIGPILLLPDSGPLITLAYADALDVLFKPGWSVQIVDMVLHELTRNETATSKAIADWVRANHVRVVPTRTFMRFQSQKPTRSALRKSNLGELAIQEALNDYALADPVPTGILLFEDHKIARTSFVLPLGCQKISTRAFLTFLEGEGWLESAAEVTQKALVNGRNFSRLHFPPA